MPIILIDLISKTEKNLSNYNSSIENTYMWISIRKKILFNIHRINYFIPDTLYTREKTRNDNPIHLTVNTKLAMWELFVFQKTYNIL